MLLQVSAENMIGLQEPTKVAMIAKVLCLSQFDNQECSIQYTIWGSN